MGDQGCCMDDTESVKYARFKETVFWKCTPVGVLGKIICLMTWVSSLMYCPYGHGFSIPYGGHTYKIYTCQVSKKSY